MPDRYLIAGALERLRAALPGANWHAPYTTVGTDDLRRVLALLDAPADAPAAQPTPNRDSRPCSGCPSDCDMCITEPTP